MENNIEIENSTEMMIENDIESFTENNIDAIIDSIIKERGKVDEIIFLDCKENRYLIKLNYNNWQSTGYFINLLNGNYYLLKKEPGHIISLKFKYIDYLDKEIIEMVESSNMGNGSIHILDYDLNELLNEYFYDSHGDELEYSDLYKYKYFLNNKNIIEGGNINIYFRDNYSLNIDYNYDENNIIRIYGFRDYILHDGNGDKKILLSQKIENYYFYDLNINKYILNENISTGDYFEWRNYLNE
jgi:hypothetical protein